MRVVRKCGSSAAACLTIDHMAPHARHPGTSGINPRLAPSGDDPDATQAVASPPDPELLRHLVSYEYRSMVIRQLQITVEWQSHRMARPRRLPDKPQQPHNRPAAAAPSAPHASPQRSPSTTQPTGAAASAATNESPSGSNSNRASSNLRDREFTRLDRLVDGRGVT